MSANSARCCPLRLCSQYRIAFAHEVHTFRASRVRTHLESP